ncbi:hypothetical protein VitviT2T_021276 [Vitis vinifera]|uniref:Dirigent protein n=1 Tax=Vitis vinifera TaxID=29760 RepID=A0ABY9D704_VITVI|nr:hypothetical protein VitviT2T_021276 [Vitis vinifera]
MTLSLEKNPSAFMVAHANLPHGLKNTSTLFNSVFVMDDPLQEAAEPTSKVIGHARDI